MTSARTPLTRTAVVTAAVEMADEQGVRGVSMRSLSQRLDVTAMALYKHVADKDDLVGAMIDLLVSGYREPEPGSVGLDRVSDRIAAARVTLLVHPWLREAIESRRSTSVAVLEHMNAVAGEFVAAGISVDLTHYAMHALGSRIWGFSAEAFDDAAPPKAAQEPEMAAVMARRFPHVAAIAMDAAARNPTGACDTDGEFTFTVELILDAIARLQDDDWRSDSW